MTDATARLEQHPSGYSLFLLQLVSFVAFGLHIPATAQIAVELGVAPQHVGATISTYLFVGAGLQLLAGLLSDFMGRRGVVLAALVLFTVSSIGCATATSMGMFTAMRAVQASAMALVALSRAIVADTRTAEESASILGYIASGMAVVTIVTPILGGVLAEHLGWRVVFFVSAFLGAMTLVLTALSLAETVGGAKLKTLDAVKGFARVFSYRKYVLYMLASAVSLSTYYAYVAAMPLIAPRLGLTSETSVGFFLTLITVGFLAGSMTSGRMAPRAGVFATAVTGRAISVVGLGLGIVALGSPDTPLWLLAIPILCAGAGDGITVPAATGAMLSDDALPRGSGAAMGGVVTLCAGGLTSYLVGVWFDNGISIGAVYAAMLIPSVLAALPLLALRPSEKEKGRPDGTAFDT